MGRVADGVAAAEVHLGELHAGLHREGRAQAHHALGGLAEGVEREDLAADVGVDAEESQARSVVAREQRLVRVARGEGEAELLVLMAGGDVLVAARVDARGHPHEYGCRHPHLARDRVQQLDLREGVNDDAADAHLESAAQFGVRFVVAVQPDARGGHPAAQRQLQLAAGRDVHVQVLVEHPPRDARREERLGRVVDVHLGAVAAECGGEVVAEGRGPSAEVRLVDDVEGGAEPAREFAKVRTADADGAVRAPDRRV